MICQKCGYENSDTSKFCVKCGMKLALNISSDSGNNSRKLAYVVAENEIIDETLLNTTVNKNTNELVSYICTNVMDKKCFKYDVNNVISIKEFLSKQIKKREFIKLLMNLINSFSNVQSLGIKLNNIFMNLSQVFVDISDMSIKLLCIPISNRKQENSIKGLIHQIIVFSEFDYNENCQYLKDIMEFIEADTSDDVGQLMGLISKYNNEINREMELKNKVNNNFPKVNLRTNSEISKKANLNNEEYNGTIVLEQDDELDGTTVLVDENYNYAYLVRKNNDEKIVLDKNIFRIGKDSRNSDYVIKDNSAISRKHAEIVVQHGNYYIIDLCSTNHTFINGKRIKEQMEVEIPQNAIIKLADEEFCIYNN